MKSHHSVCVLGLWHLGCVYAACLAKLGYDVVGVDEDSRTIDNLREGKAPLYEPGLEDLIASGVANGNLRFTDRIEEGAKAKSYVIIAYDTPVDEDDNVDLSNVYHSTEKLKLIASNAVIIVSSQVPVGTCERLASLLLADNPNLDLAYVPENLKLGQAIARFMKPEMLVIGANKATVIARVRALFEPIQTRVIEMDLKSAEMTKHALNGFLSTSISFANEIGNICDLIGADAVRVAEAMKSDSRVGSKALLRPGLGFSGGTLARDLRILQRLGKKYGYDTELINAVIAVNERQNNSIVERLRRLMSGLEGKSVAVLGLTYKAGTSTLRRSGPVAVITQLRDEGVSVKAFDPYVDRTDLLSWNISLCGDAYSACKDADALIVLNDTPDFADLDFDRIRNLMKVPVVLDTQNLLDPQEMTQYGFRYFGVGRGSMHSLC